MRSRNSVIVSDIWRKFFQDRGSIGQARLTVDDQVYAIVGVMPAGMHEPATLSTGVWLPLAPADTGSAWFPEVRLRAGATRSRRGAARKRPYHVGVSGRPREAVRVRAASASARSQGTRRLLPDADRHRALRPRDRQREHHDAHARARHRAAARSRVEAFARRGRTCARPRPARGGIGTGPEWRHRGRHVRVLGDWRGHTFCGRRSRVAVRARPGVELAILRDGGRRGGGRRVARRTAAGVAGGADSADGAAQGELGWNHWAWRAARASSGGGRTRGGALRCSWRRRSMRGAHCGSAISSSGSTRATCCP